MLLFMFMSVMTATPCTCRCCPTYGVSMSFSNLCTKDVKQVYLVLMCSYKQCRAYAAIASHTLSNVLLHNMLLHLRLGERLAETYAAATCRLEACCSCDWHSCMLRAAVSNLPSSGASLLVMLSILTMHRGIKHQQLQCIHSTVSMHFHQHVVIELIYLFLPVPG